jgi:hypothetical protein
VQIERVDFVSIPTHDTARALAWYREASEEHHERQ